MAQTGSWPLACGSSRQGRRRGRTTARASTCRHRGGTGRPCTWLAINKMLTQVPALLRFRYELELFGTSMLVDVLMARLHNGPVEPWGAWLLPEISYPATESSLPTPSPPNLGRHPHRRGEGPCSASMKNRNKPDHRLISYIFQLFGLDCRHQGGSSPEVSRCPDTRLESPSIRAGGVWVPQTR
jgi:hypothetical protein